METTSSTFDSSSVLTPEKLAVIKLRSSELGRDDFDDDNVESAGDGLFGFGSGMRSSKNSRALTRTSRQISTASRRSGSFMQSHRSKMSMELTTQAEAKVFALIELMSNASREATSLKEYWTKLMSDRESFDKEREELVMRIDELAEALERTQTQHHDRHRELGERKKEAERLMVELTAALGGLTEHRTKLADRDRDVDGARRELQEAKLTSIRLQTEHDKLKVELDGLLPRLRLLEGERDRAKSDTETFRGQARDLGRENADLKGRNGDITAKLDGLGREVAGYLERIRVLERERAGDVFERERLEEAVRKATARADDSGRELAELSERSLPWQRDAKRLRETLSSVEAERDEHVTVIERLRLELRTKTSGLEDAEKRHGEVHLRFEQLKRDIGVKEDRFTSLEGEVGELRRNLEVKQEEHRRTLLDNDQLRDELDTERRRFKEHRSEFDSLRDLHSKSDSSLSEIRAESLHAGERIRQLERERDDANERVAALNKEVVELREKLGRLQTEARTAGEGRERARKELHELRRKYEEVTTTISEWKDDSGELEYEIESLRTMLYEAREQKERAIAARNAADRERDEYVEKYDDKCREFEKMADSRSSFFSSSGHSHGHGHGHSHGHGHGKGESRTTSTRFVTRSSGTNGQDEETVETED